MDQREQKINELLLDNRFVDWVMDPESQYREYWLQWTCISAENASLADEARRFLLDLRRVQREGEEAGSNSGLTESMWDHISASIMKEDGESFFRPYGVRPVRRLRRYGLAAAVMMGLALLLSITLFRKRTTPGSQERPQQERQLASTEIIRYNGSGRNEIFYLPDGSHVVLAKGARISYSRLLSGAKREVSLAGEAFFDVAPNSDKPFYIYTPNMVVKILGTSLRVATGATEESVAVKTGKVSVFMKGQDLEQTAAKILYPQQACTFSVQKRQLTMAAPLKASKIEISSPNVNEYNFDDAPLNNVFKALEKMYAIPVRYDSVALKECFITIRLGNESLENKLQVITKTIGASFSISDYGIDVEGGGCK